MPLLIDSAELAGLVIEGCLYGIFMTFITIAAHGFFHTRGPESLTSPMLTTGVLLVILCTTRLAIDTANVFVAFIKHSDRASRIGYLSDVRAPLFTTKHSLLVGVLFVEDSFVNWRCWVVWGKDLRIVVAPIILSITSTVSGSYTMWAYGHLPKQQILSESRWLTPFYVLSLVAHAMSTGLLAWRIYAVRRQMNSVQRSNTISKGNHSIPQHGHQSLKPILYIVLESGALNAAYLFACTMCLVSKSQGFEVMSEMACPLTGIIFVVVIVRVGLHAKCCVSSGKRGWTTESSLVFADGSNKGGSNAESGRATDPTAITMGDVDGDSSRAGDLEMGRIVISTR